MSESFLEARVENLELENRELRKRLDAECKAIRSELRLALDDIQKFTLERIARRLNSQIGLYRQLQGAVDTLDYRQSNAFGCIFEIRARLDALDGGPEKAEDGFGNPDNPAAA